MDIILFLKILGYIVLYTVYSLIWAFAISTIAKNKGYYNERVKWFWLGFFFGIIALIVILTKPSIKFSISDELLKYKELLDKGAITQGEFEKKKKELL